jgi:hypothetical protein
MYALIPQLSRLLFQIYSFINCLREYTQHPALLPADGVSPKLELKPLAQFISLGFWSHDISSRFHKFDTPYSSAVAACFFLHYFEKHRSDTFGYHRKTMTYVWFSSMRSLLYLYQRLSAASMEAEFRFLPCHHVRPYTRDGQHFIDIIQDYDTLSSPSGVVDRLLSSQVLF